jgi:intracellular sulfur oxidation DsrE/DsrF family protein
MNRRDFALTGAIAAATGLRGSEALAQSRAAGASSAPDALRAVFHFGDPEHDPNFRGLQNAINAVRAAGASPPSIIVVVHGPALRWFRSPEPQHVGELLASALATGHVSWRVCRVTLEEHRWRAEDLLPGATIVPSGSLEVLRLQHEGYVYFAPA